MSSFVIRSISMKIIIFYNTKGDWDLILMLHDILDNCCNDSSIKFHWVKGCADLLDQPLSRDESLNMEVDLWAEETERIARGTMAARTVCINWTINVILLSLRNGKVTSRHKDKLKLQLHQITHHIFIKDNGSWIQQTFVTFNRLVCRTAFKWLSQTFQGNVSKSNFNYRNTRARHSIFYQEPRPFCLCKNETEDWKHILTCESLNVT
jgi:hypothetical protein